jgi:hypothetical protein
MCRRTSRFGGRRNIAVLTKKVSELRERVAGVEAA